MTEPFYSRKKSKIIIVQKINGKNVYLKQLPKPEKLLEILRHHEQEKSKSSEKKPEVS